jgi:hypothetical protein
MTALPKGLIMPKQTHNPNPAGRAGNPVSLHGLTPDQAISAFLKIKPADVEKIKEATKLKAAKGKRKGK